MDEPNEYEELVEKIIPDSPTLSGNMGVAWSRGHLLEALTSGLLVKPEKYEPLTDAQCDEFRRLPVDFNAMLRNCHFAGYCSATKRR